MHMTNALHIATGTAVRTWDGRTGTVLYHTNDGWYGVRIDGECRADEWQAEQLEVVS